MEFKAKRLQNFVKSLLSPWRIELLMKLRNKQIKIYYISRTRLLSPFDWNRNTEVVKN